MSTLKERVERLERTLNAEEPEPIIVVQLVHDLDDLRSLPGNPEEWVSWKSAYAQRELPIWPGGPIIVTVDSATERELRIRRTTGQKN